MKLRRLTQAGIVAFGEYLDALEQEPTRLMPTEVLNNPVLSEPLPVDVEITQREFGSRYAAAEYFDDQFSDAGLSEIERDAGLWSWLALFYFDEICPPDRSGARSPGERARYILQPGNFQRYYRHLLAGAYRVYRAHRKNPKIALVVLCQQLHKPGDIVEQFTSRQELVTNAAVLEAATLLYIDTQTKLPKLGAQTKNAGAARRLADVLKQFDVTWDLYSTQVRELLGILPQEFERFRSTSVS
jgi:hypothetical protein